MKKLPKRKASGPEYPVGDMVLILRPHLWSGCVGEVVSILEGFHRIRVSGTRKEGFLAEACGDELKPWPFKTSPILARGLSPERAPKSESVYPVYIGNG